MSMEWEEDIYGIGGGDDDDDFFSTDSEASEDYEEPGTMGHPAMDFFTIGGGTEYFEPDRVVKTTKRKRYEEMDKIIKRMRQSMNINDWGAIATDWGLLTKAFDKSKSVVEVHGMPLFYVGIHLALEEFINETLENKELKKNMKPKNARSFNAVKQKFKKYLKENEYLEENMAEYKQTGEPFDAYDLEHEFGDEEDLSVEEEEDQGEDLGDEEPEDWTPEKITNKIKELLSKRGTKNYEKKTHFKTFTVLRTKVEGLAKQLSIDFYIINTLFDMAPPSHPLATHLWIRIYNTLVSIINELNEHPELQFFESKDEAKDATGEKIVVGHLLSMLDHLGEEYNHSLQHIESPSEQYLVRLSHENYLLRLYEHAKAFYIRRGDLKRAAIVTEKIMYYLHYRKEMPERGQPEQQEEETEEEKEPEASEELSAKELKKREEAAAIALLADTAVKLVPPEAIKDDWKITEVVSQLCSFICKNHTEERAKRRAILQLIYHYAIHDQFFRARDLLLMTHLQESIHKARTSLQVIFNRAMVQIGLCAFRLGRIKDAHNCLQEIQSGGKPKMEELLAQGINSRYQGEKTKEQEKQEYRRQVPYHLVINTDLIECVYFVSAMLLDIPTMAQNHHKDTKQKIISKAFDKQMISHGRLIWTGPPETVKDCIIVAAKALREGNWKKCRDDILKLPVWKLIPNSEAILKELGCKIQQEGLRTFLFTYGQCYDSLSHQQLCEMFEMEENEVHAVVSKMMITGELDASWDQPTGAIIMHSRDPTDLQYLSLTFAEKINILLESSEPPEPRTYERSRGGWNDPNRVSGQKKPTPGQRVNRTRYGAQTVPVTNQGFTTRRNKRTGGYKGRR